MNSITEKHKLYTSGFNDDSSESSEEEKRPSKISHFLMKSHLTNSLKKINKDKKTNSYNGVKRASSSNTVNNNNNNNIIEAYSLEDIKVSINSEDEENLEIKKKVNKGIKEKENNDLKSNLLLNPVEDNLLFNFKNKISTFSSTDDILRDTIKLSLNPINRTNKFSKSRSARTFMYEEKGDSKNYLLKSKKFGMAKNKNIITYILNLYIFSEFSNFNDLEKDTRIKLFFIPSINKQFTPNIQNVLSSLNMDNNKSNQLTKFINGINELMNDKEYNEIQRKNKNFKICLFLLNIILFLLIAGMSYSFYYFYDFIFKQEPKIMISILASAGIIALLLIVLFVIQLIRLVKLDLYIKYNNLNYMLINYSRFNDYIDEWNKDFFELNKIIVSVPISLNYIMFNLEPYQSIEIKHLDMRWFIDKVYKDKKSIANDKEFIKYFIKVRSTLVESKNI